jgi:hypothetical protein
MGFLADIVNVGTSGLAGQVVGAIEKYFPPEMTMEQKLNIQIQLNTIEVQRQTAANAAQQEAEKDLNDRIAMYEGTASDLKSLPLLGNVMLFLRGAQRPVWGFACLYLDYGVFSGLWKLTDPMVSNAFWVVNFLVLGFLFGERAVMNVMPFITNMIAAKKGG